jgi:hypothetical protein
MGADRRTGTGQLPWLYSETSQEFFLLGQIWRRMLGAQTPHPPPVLKLRPFGLCFPSSVKRKLTEHYENVNGIYQISRQTMQISVRMTHGSPHAIPPGRADRH